MFAPQQIYRAPADTGTVTLGRTLPSLLDEACDRNPNAQALNQWTSKGWQPLSNQAFRKAAEEVALGLRELGLQAGDRVALFMHSDTQFCIADMGCLLAKLVNVPISLGEVPENIALILQHSGASALILSDIDLLERIAPCLGEVHPLKTLILVDTLSTTQQHLSQEEGEGWGLPSHVSLLSLAEVQAKGRANWSPPTRRALRDQLAADDLATIIYVAGATGRCQDIRSSLLPMFRMVKMIRERLQNHAAPQYVCETPKGVMLTHENLSADALAAFSEIVDLKRGPQEVVLSFLPLTHIFARVLLYGHINYGHTVHFSTPTRVIKHLRDVKPTVFATVPRLLEKVAQKIEERSHRLQGFSRWVFTWALELAKRYELGQIPNFVDTLQLKLADRWVYRQWRMALGGRLKYLLTGGAALKADLANLFAAAGLPIMQGYGLTQTSAVICVNRGQYNRAGTVGPPIAGVEMAVAEDGEILIKAPYVMKGYYHNPTATQEAIDENGWFHTGDVGEFTAEGFLKLTGYKKSLFKLSTGKYVTPEPLERHVMQSPLVDYAIAVGASQRFCAMLIFPNWRRLRAKARSLGLTQPVNTLLKEPHIQALYQDLVETANQGLPDWSKAKKFQLVDAELTVNNGLLSPKHQIQREQVQERFADVIEQLYGEALTIVRPAYQPQATTPELPPLQVEAAT